jgi:hypothetical protein
MMPENGHELASTCIQNYLTGLEPDVIKWRTAITYPVNVIK